MSKFEFKSLVDIWDKLTPSLQIPLIIVGALLILCGIVSLVISIYLGISYYKFNRKENSVKKTGEEIARKVLDDNGLNNIAVKCSGSLVFGNSYSHYFKKVRLRRLTWKKTSVSSMAMAVEKSCLAILDKEQDPDMLMRVRLTPFIYVGPLACIPLILIGAALDMFVLNSNGVVTVAASVIGLLFYALSFIMSIKVLRTEIKAQNRAYEIARESGIANEEEIADMHKLFRLYNIEYVNDMITALLELIYRILMILAQIQGNSSSSK